MPRLLIHKLKPRHFNLSMLRVIRGEEFSQRGAISLRAPEYSESRKSEGCGDIRSDMLCGETTTGGNSVVTRAGGIQNQSREQLKNSQTAEESQFCATNEKRCQMMVELRLLEIGKSSGEKIG